MYKKFALDIIVLLIFLLGIAVMMKKFSASNLVEEQEDAQLKRLFGDAWKEAKKL